MFSTVVLASDHWSDGRWDGPGPWWPIFPILWFAFIVFVIVMFARFGPRRWHRGSYAGQSRLAERYAAGEIDESEYRQRLAVLREKSR